MMRPRVADCRPMPKKKSKPVDRAPRLSVTVSHEMLRKLDLVNEITGMPSRTDAARYVMARGLETLNTPLSALAMMKRMGDQYSPDELLPLFAELEKKGST